MIDYTIFYRQTLPIDCEWPAQLNWDLFLSAFTSADRVRILFDKVRACEKRWVVFPEYGYEEAERPSSDVFVAPFSNEAQFIKDLWRSLPEPEKKGRMAVDVTGFIRPYLIFLMRWFVQIGVKRFDAFYSEPIRYVKGEQTRFSGEEVTEVRQVIGFEGSHFPDTSKDVLIIGSGYDDKLIAEVAEHKDQARKVQIFGLPSLRADMYQENVLRAHRAEEAVGCHMGDETSSFFAAPANDPFVTAAVLQEIVTGLNARKHLTNLYLSPLATKPQVIGFALYFLTECVNSSVSMIFPFCQTYSRETSTGLARVWRYTVELPETLPGHGG